MNEVTRIHLAKTAYDIEVAAKKQLEKYIKSLETYTQDQEVLNDIEIRMTELLAERGVAANGVISSEDVKAIRAQLGEPYEFADEESDMAIGANPTEPSGRRLYRSTDNAVLGGVLSGIAAYFNVNPLWTRLVFILLILISYGTAIIVYIVLWIVTPAARTATEKLQLAGREVTLESIKELNIHEEKAAPSRVAPILQTVLLIGAGLLSALAAVGAFFATLWGIFVISIGTSENSPVTHYIPTDTWGLWVAYGLLVLAGLLLTALFTLFSVAAFKRTYTKRMGIATIAIVIAGVLSAGAAGSMIAYHGWKISEQQQRDISTKKVVLPATFGEVKKLKVDVGNDSIGWGDYSDARVEYIVSDTNRYEFTSPSGATPKIAIDGDTATVTIERAEKRNVVYRTPELKIYGPALSDVTVQTGWVSYTATERQAQLTLTSQENSGNIDVYGSYGTLIANGGTMNLGGSSIEVLEVNSGAAGRVEAGTVRTLRVTQPDVCPSTAADGYNDSRSQIIVRGVTSGTLTYNNVERAVRTYENPCGVLIIGDENAYMQSREEQ